MTTNRYMDYSIKKMSDRTWDFAFGVLFDTMKC